MPALIWSIFRPLLPYLLALGAIAGAYWYVTSLQASNSALRADLGAANDQLRKTQSHIRQLREQQARQRETDAESARLAARVRDRVPATVASLRDYAAGGLPAIAAGNTDCTSDSPQAESAAVVAGQDRGGEIYAACAATDAALEVLRAEVLRMDRELSELRIPHP